MEISATRTSAALALSPRAGDKPEAVIQPSPQDQPKVAPDSFVPSQAAPPASYAQPPRPSPANTTNDAQPLPETDTPLKRTYGDKDREALFQAWGAREGDARFAADYDFDGNGLINSADLAALLGSYTPADPPPPVVESTDDSPAPAAPELSGSAPALTLEKPLSAAEATPAQRVLNAWGRKAGEKGFDESVDLNGDGLINSQDLAAALGGQTKQAAAAEPATQRVYTSTDLNQFLKSWGARNGEGHFSADYDFDGDGLISSTDLAQLLGRLAEQKKAEGGQSIARA